MVIDLQGVTGWPGADRSGASAVTGNLLFQVRGSR